MVGDPRRVVAYIRTSSAEQGKAYGPEVQRRTIKAYAKANALEIVAEVHEDISGTVAASLRVHWGRAVHRPHRPLTRKGRSVSGLP